MEIKQEKDSEHEGKLESKKEDTTQKVKQEEDSEHDGTFENKEDKMTERCDITIPVFDGEDCHMWKKRITIYVKFKKCDKLKEKKSLQRRKRGTKKN